MDLPAQIAAWLRPASPMRPMEEDAYDIPFGTLVRPWSEAERGDVGLVGIPFDTTTIIRRGARFGPRVVRDALATSTTFEPGLDADLRPLRIVDFGDVDVLQTDLGETWRRIEEVMAAVAVTGVVPIVIGGDHGNTYPVVAGIARTWRRIGLLIFDAHYDVRISHHGEPSSGVPFRYLLNRLGPKVLAGANIVEVGPNGWHAAQVYAQYCREQGITVIPAREVHRQGRVERVIEAALERVAAATDGFWISVDIDSVEAALAPGTNALNVGGLTSFQLLEMIYLASRHTAAIGMDVMEVAPAYDVGGVTANLAASCVLHFMAGLLRRRQAQ